VLCVIHLVAFHNTTQHNTTRNRGIINWYQRYRGVMRVELDLHRFPFDKQMIRLRFGCTLWGEVRCLSAGLVVCGWLQANNTVGPLHLAELIITTPQDSVLLVDRTDPALLPKFDATVNALHEWSLVGSLSLVLSLSVLALMHVWI
jgi:hypothetical protein